MEKWDLRELQETIERSPVVVFQQDLNLRYVWIYNPGLGRESKELVGRSDREILEDPEELKQLEAVKRKVLETCEPCRQEVQVTWGKQKLFYDLALDPVLDDEKKVIGLRGVGVDVTDKRKMQAALEKSERILQSVLNSLPIGVWFIEPCGKIILANRAAQELWDGARYVGPDQYGQYKGWWPDTEKPVAPEEWAVYQTLKTKEAVIGQVVDIESFDGKRRTIVNSSYPVKGAQNEVVGVIAVNEDITRRIQLEREVKEREQEHRRAQHLEAIGTLASGVAHNFNNLIMVIQGAVELAQKNLPTESASQRFLRVIHQACDRAGGITRELLSFSPKDVARKEPVNFTALVREGVSMIRELFPASIEMEDALPLEPIWVSGDRGQLLQILLNLAINARDAMPQGGKIHISLTIAPTGFLQLVFQDSGVGMKSENLSRIFEPFFSTKERGTGGGLGLAIVHGVVEKHMGTIEVQSTPNSGTQFTIRLPTVPSPEQNHLSSSQRGRSYHFNSDKKPVLLVEDNAVLRDILVSNLKNEGIPVVEADQGQEAIHLYNQHHGDIGLVILDLDLPRVSGTVVYEHIRKQCSKIPILILSGAHEENTVWDKKTWVVRKPCSPTLLLELVRSCAAESTSLL